MCMCTKIWPVPKNIKRFIRTGITDSVDDIWVLGTEPFFLLRTVSSLSRT